MEQNVEGLLIGKRPYQERHVLASVLLRSGKKISAIFLGGKGGGKNQKGSSVELGSMLQIHLVHGSSQAEIKKANEWKPIWMPLSIRENHQAFYLSCFMFDVVERMSVVEDLHDEHHHSDQSHVGVFRLLSNALFRIDKKCEEKNFVLKNEVALFLGKLLVETGIFPELSECMHCGVTLTPHHSMQLAPEHGGFSCSSCVARELGQGAVADSGNEIWRLLDQISHHKYQEIVVDRQISNEALKALFNYFSFQSQINTNSLKTLSVLNLYSN